MKTGWTAVRRSSRSTRVAMARVLGLLLVTAAFAQANGSSPWENAGQAMGAYEYQRWAEPPSEMLNDLLLWELRVSGRCRHVYSLRGDTRGGCLLRGQLHDLREISGNGLAASVAFEFELYDSKAVTAVWSRSYSHDEHVNGKDLSAVAAAMDRNVQSGLTEIMGGLVGISRQRLERLPRLASSLQPLDRCQSPYTRVTWPSPRNPLLNNPAGKLPQARNLQSPRSLLADAHGLRRHTPAPVATLPVTSIAVPSGHPLPFSFS